MAHHAEPMDVDVDDIESDFDNKENTYHHSNVLPRTPCTEKGYEELDVSELNMKLRYSITPAVSPMSKSMSHCLDNRYNASTDESLNNTIVNENENNLTRSLHSALNKAASIAPKVLPPQSLPADLTVDSDRNATILQPLVTKNDNKNITITVSNESEIDNLSFPSSSSSMTHTPEATTPTKEIPKDGGSPIMRGLKSVLSMFRSSQSPIPPAEAENKILDAVSSPTDIQSLDSKPQAMASTPINQRNKEKSISRRNSPHKESLVFNEDLEKELQWNDDSTIVFSTEKIPIHKLFFQDKPASSKPDNLQQPVIEDVNSSVEYMDVSYNDGSMRERTLNAIGNKSMVNDIPESDGEFVDCETTITQDECQTCTEDINSDKFDIKQDNTEKILTEDNAAVTEMPFLDTTEDILKLIDGSQIDVNADQTVRQLDFSTTDIVNQLSDLINATKTVESNVSLDKHKVDFSNTETPKLTNVLEQTLTEQPKLLENVVTRSENPVFSENISSIKDAENVSIENNKIENVILDTTLPSEKVVSNIEPVLPVISSAPAKVIFATDKLISHNIKNNDSERLETVEKTSDGMLTHPLPCDIPLPNEDDFNELAHNFEDESLHAEKTLTEFMPIVEAAQNTLFSALDKTTELSLETKLENYETEKENPNISCQLNLLPSDVPLPDMDDNHSIKIDSLLHEAVTVVPDPVQPQLANFNNEVRNIETALPSGNVSVENITQTIVPDIPIATDTGNNNEEIKMEVSYCEQLTENSPPNSVLDVPATTVSSVELDELTKISDSPKQSQPMSIDNLPSKIELPEVNIQEINIVSQENVVISEKHIESELDQPAPASVIENNAFKDNFENVQGATNLQSLESIETLSNVNVVEAITSSVIVPETSLDSNIDDTKSPDIQINISHDVNNVDTIHDSEPIKNATLTASALCSEVPSLPLTPLVEKTDEVSADDPTAEASNITDASNDVCTKTGPDTTDIVKNLLQPEAEIDEEIVVSENSSPFVSISAEEEIDVQVKNENLEDPLNSISTKSPLPPLSPKIVSKGYNLNFDDLDAMNPFATKTKIRMSPPPGASPNRLPETEPVEYQKIEKPVLFEKGKNDNRRKSMPEKRKPLKSKRTFNSTLDSTESATSKLVGSKNQRDVNCPKKEVGVKQDIISQLSDIAQTDVIIPVSDEVLPEATNLDGTHEEINNEVNSHTKTTLPAESLEHNPHNTIKIFEDAVMSESRKSTVISDNTSSSEQSAYFSAVASSTECTEPKNVFNLPEIDDKNFNPFATKSKVCQSPPPNLDMVNPFATKCKIKSSPESSLVITPNDVNTTVTVDTESEFKETNYNLSNCSDFSKTSDEKDITVQEVHTEDEDTIEGPFLEAEDSNETDNIPELDDDKVEADLNNINAQVNEDDTDAAEMFIDAEAFEFLMNQNNTDEVAYSGKESLFLKFDPLFARRVTSEGVAAALTEIKKRQSTPKRMPKPMPPKNEELMSFDEQAGPSDLNKTPVVQCDVEDTHDDMNVTVLSKPMMAVTPAVNPVVTPKKSLTPTRANRLSMTFTSPAMAVIDRLLSLSGNSPSAGLNTTITHASPERTEADQALTQLRELLAEKEINVYNLRCESKELKSRLTTLETQMKSLEVVSSERLQKINDLTENLAEKTKMNRSMAAVVEEYERTIASLISETEQDKKRYAEERMQLIRERDEQTAHLTSMEVSFSDLHSKYEKSKQVIIGYKTNEEAYKNSIKEFEDNLAKMHSNYELLKQHATSKLNHANQELEKLNKAHESEVLKYNAMIKRKDLHITSLEESLAQKIKANEELTAICDELINKVG